MTTSYNKQSLDIAVYDYLRYAFNNGIAFFNNISMYNHMHPETEKTILTILLNVSYNIVDNLDEVTPESTVVEFVDGELARRMAQIGKHALLRGYGLAQEGNNTNEERITQYFENFKTLANAIYDEKQWTLEGCSSLVADTQAKDDKDFAESQN